VKVSPTAGNPVPESVLPNTARRITAYARSRPIRRRLELYNSVPYLLLSIQLSIESDIIRHREG
jgi:hypothetical protein